MGAIEGIDGRSDIADRIDTIRDMMGLNDPIEEKNDENISSAPSSDATQVESVVPLNEVKITPPSDSVGFEISNELAGNATSVVEVLDNGNEVKRTEQTEEGEQSAELKKDTDGDGVPDYLDSSPNGDESAPATQAFLNEMLSTDSDGDGILDFLDQTGSESQIEQMYDKDFERKLEARKEEAMRGFFSIMSMFNNLDLTKFSGKLKEAGGDSLITMAAAGAAQVALTHSARLQELPKNHIPQKADLKQLIKQYKNKSQAAKLNNLKLLNYCVEAMPETNPMKEILKNALKSVESASKHKKT
ncbi:MAG: hypothetical protein LBR92_00925 [Puniceicoccales bacterium]|jgi:hypothetical protein|nr:hypothetical protein [Puniceicoccales bacterium]